MEDFKTCIRCSQTKSLDAFTKHRGKPLGVTADCKLCRNEFRRKRYAENPDSIKAQNRKSYLRHKDSYVERAKKWAKDNPEKAYQRSQKYLASKIGLASSYSNAYRTRKRLNGTFTIRPRFLKNLYSSPCFYCGSGKSIQADHVIPISRGGQHSEGNLVAACKSCNISKNNRFIVEWKRQKKAP